MRDDPIIENMMRSGYPGGKEPEQPHCPKCGAECYEILYDRWGCLVGCNECVSTRDAWESDECFPGRDE